MSSDAVTVFFSYSHKDETLRDELANHLEILKWCGDISAWHDRKILPGDEWDREIKDNLNSAQIILLLISSDFIASSYCRDIEIKRAIERHQAEEACVIPVILRRCIWTSAPFGKLQALPKNAAPVADTNIWPTLDDAFTNIAEGIKKAADDVRQKLKAVKQAKLSQYEAAYQQAIQQEYPLSDVNQNKLDRLQTALGLTEMDIAPIVTRLSSQYGEVRQKLEQYRDEVRLCLQDDGGEISPFSRSILDGYRTTFGLTFEEAKAVEQEELKPYKAKAEAIEQYTNVFADALNHENPPSEAMRRRMQRFQSTLGLSDEEAQEIEATLQQEAERQKSEDERQRQHESESHKDLDTTETSVSEAEVEPQKPSLPEVNRKELSECEPSKILFLKNVRDPNGVWAYTVERIQNGGGDIESRVFELFWLSTSRGAKTASKGDLMLLNQFAKITHIVEMLDDEVRENEAGYFRWVRIVWMPEEEDWSQLPHQRDVIGFEPPTIGGGTAYSLANLSKLQETWNSLEAFQQRVVQVLTGAKPPLMNEVDETLSSERFGANYYGNLRDLLAAQEWEAADQETAYRMCEVMDQQKKGWLRHEDIKTFPCLDLHNIDRLWVKYGQGKFGFSVQKKIWESCGSPTSYGSSWEKFGVAVGWRSKGFLSIGAEWKLYSNLTFNMTAPDGHLPARAYFGGCFGVFLKGEDREVEKLLGVIDSLLSRPDL
ncbi:GUN4 domain-containing protein [Oscillatoria sp. CS-180]|uniref:GUN4 domain-containing protein n=1 Tax=Oscillatoria sp. CS-180 TaxID=3021720 RepID=UPI00232B6525|nr:GUN4 domain-containing protein [Oscillatoria sp. CS-180]MDB9527899.1 GUN4 domain-containing protein [Oscillatoria sp. CS-180]